MPDDCGQCSELLAALQELSHGAIPIHVDTDAGRPSVTVVGPSGEVLGEWHGDEPTVAPHKRAVTDNVQDMVTIACETFRDECRDSIPGFALSEAKWQLRYSFQGVTPVPLGIVKGDGPWTPPVVEAGAQHTFTVSGILLDVRQATLGTILGEEHPPTTPETGWIAERRVQYRVKWVYADFYLGTRRGEPLIARVLVGTLADQQLEGSSTECHPVPCVWGTEAETFVEQSTALQYSFGLTHNVAAFSTDDQTPEIGFFWSQFDWTCVGECDSDRSWQQEDWWHPERTTTRKLIEALEPGKHYAFDVMIHEPYGYAGGDALIAYLDGRTQPDTCQRVVRGFGARDLYCEFSSGFKPGALILKDESLIEGNPYSATYPMPTVLAVPVLWWFL